MLLVLMHVDDMGRAAHPMEEEASFVVPGGPKTVLMAPFAAMDQVLARMDDLLPGPWPDQRCGACGGELTDMAPRGPR